MRLLSSLDNQLVATFVAPCLKAQCRLAPGCLRAWHSNRRPALTTAMWMISRRHSRTTHRWSPSPMPVAARFAQGDVTMVDIAYLANCRHASLVKTAQFA